MAAIRISTEIQIKKIQQIPHKNICVISRGITVSYEEVCRHSTSELGLELCDWTSIGKVWKNQQNRYDNKVSRKRDVILNTGVMWLVSWHMSHFIFAPYITLYTVNINGFNLLIRFNLFCHRFELMNLTLSVNIWKISLFSCKRWQNRSSNCFIRCWTKYYW